MGKYFTLRRKICAFLLPVVLGGGALSCFQNCAPVNLQNSKLQIPARSPFFAQRVLLLPKLGSDSIERIDKEDSEVQQENKKEDDKFEALNVIVDNACAIHYCSDKPRSDKENPTKPEFSFEPAVRESSLICAPVMNGVHKSLLELTQAYAIGIPTEKTQQAIEDLLKSNPIDDECIVGVSEIHSYKTHNNPVSGPDPDLIKQYYHDLIGGTSAYPFFDAILDGMANVAIIDSGVNFSRMSGTFSHDANGHKDLQIPFYEKDNSSTVVAYSKNFSDRCPDAICNDHGTMVAGIIAANNNNSLGGRGIAPFSRILSAQVGNSEGRITTTELYNAVEHVSNVGSYNGQGVDVINLSLGGFGSQDYSYQHALIKAVEKDILLVTAAGNDAKNLNFTSSYPASFNFDSQINVGAASPVSVQSQKPGPYDLQNAVIKRDAFSNYGDSIVHIAAPGKGIYSTSLNQSHRTLDGTSFAAPMVTAAASLAVGYLKSKGIRVSSGMLKELVLSGSRSLPEMRERDSEGKEFSPFQEDRFLDLGTLRSVLESYAGKYGKSVPEVLLVESETLGSGNQKKIKLQLQIRNADIGSGLKLRIYTNKAFLEESYTGLSCDFVTLNQCTLEVPFEKLLIDSSLYITITDADGKLIADLEVPIAKLNLGSRQGSQLDGEVVAVHNHNNRFVVEGWACLVGFPDEVKIRAELDQKAFYQYGSVVKAETVTNVAARGDYFKRCQSPSIAHGFRLNLYSYYPGTVTLTAEHGEGSNIKILKLPVLVYQPGYNDPKPPQKRESFSYFPIQYGNPKIKITKKSFRNYILNLEGHICGGGAGGFNHNYSNTFSLSIKDNDLNQLVPELVDIKGVDQNLAGPSLQAARPSIYGGLKAVGGGYVFKNPSPAEIDDAGQVACCGGFSEIANQGSILEPRKPAQNVQILKIAEINSGASLGTFNPSFEAGDQCPEPSGFRIEKDIRPHISAIQSSVGVTYLTSKYASDEAALSAVGLSKMLDLFKLDIDRPLAEARFDQRAFSLTLEHVETRTKLELFLDIIKSWHFHNLYSVRNDSVMDTWQKIVQTGNADSGSAYLLQKVDKVLSPSPQSNLTTVYTSKEVVLPVQGLDRLFVGFRFENGKKIGVHDRDLVLEAQINQSGVWRLMRLDLPYVDRSIVGNFKGVFFSDMDFPDSIQSVQIRVRANGNNDVSITHLGVFTP